MNKVLEAGNEENYTEARKVDTKHGEFANSLKYDVVKEMLKRQSKESEKIAKKEISQSEQNKDDELDK